MGTHKSSAVPSCACYRPRDQLRPTKWASVRELCPDATSLEEFLSRCLNPRGFKHSVFFICQHLHMSTLLVQNSYNNDLLCLISPHCSLGPIDTHPLINSSVNSHCLPAVLSQDRILSVGWHGRLFIKTQSPPCSMDRTIHIIRCGSGCVFERRIHFAAVLRYGVLPCIIINPSIPCLSAFRQAPPFRSRTWC